MYTCLFVVVILWINVYFYFEPVPPFRLQCNKAHRYQMEEAETGSKSTNTYIFNYFF